MSFEDEYAAAADEETAAAPMRPGFHRSRVQVLPETRITASPEGGGTVRGGLGTEANPIGDVETVETETKDAPTAPLSQEDYDAGLSRLAEAEDDAELEGTSSLEDLAMSGSALGGHQAQQRTGTRLRHAVRDPMAALFGASEGASMGGDDEFWGAIRSAQDAAQGRYHHGSYRQHQQEAETASEAAEERDPTAFGVGEFAGAVGGALATAPLAPIEGAGVAGRLAGGALTGELYGAASGALHSDATLEDDPSGLLHDASAGGLEGLLLGTAVGGVGEGVRAGGRHLGRMAEGADLARVASVAPGRTISRTDPTIAQFASHPGGIEGQAERLRRMRIVSPAATSRDVFERAGSEYDRIGDEVLGPIRERIAEGGPVRTTRPRHGPDLPGAPERVGEEAAGAPSVVDPLYAYADELARSPDSTDRSFAPSVREQADAMLDAWGDHVPYEEAERQLRVMGQRTQWVSPSTGQPVRPPTEIRQEVYRRMRRGLDDLAEPRVPEGDVERFREGRLDAQTTRTARDLAEARMGRDAQSAPIGLIDSSLATAAGAAGAGPVGTAATAIASRGIRGRSGALRATGLDAVRSMVEAGRGSRLGSWAPVLERALASGLPAFTVAHTRAMRDPEYAAAVEAAESEDPEAEAAFLDMYDSLSPQEATP